MSPTAAQVWYAKIIDFKQYLVTVLLSLLQILEHISTTNLQGMAFQDHFEIILQRVPFFFSWPVADLPTQPPVGLWNPKTPLQVLC